MISLNEPPVEIAMKWMVCSIHPESRRTIIHAVWEGSERDAHNAGRAIAERRGMESYFLVKI